MVRIARWIVETKNHDDEIIFLHDNNIKLNTLKLTSYTSSQLIFIQLRQWANPRSLILIIEGARDHSFKKFVVVVFFLFRDRYPHRNSTVDSTATVVAVAVGVEGGGGSIRGWLLSFILLIRLVCCYCYCHRVCVSYDMLFCSLVKKNV